MRRASSAACSRLSPNKRTSAPIFRHDWILVSGAVVGITTTARKPARVAARATPLRMVAGRGGNDTCGRMLPAMSRPILWVAPRILNEPVRCRFSSLSCSDPELFGERIVLPLHGADHRVGNALAGEG